MQKIYLVTKSFPYTNEEKSFLGPEYEFLKKEFEITLITTDISFDIVQASISKDSKDKMSVLINDAA